MLYLNTYFIFLYTWGCIQIFLGKRGYERTKLRNPTLVHGVGGASEKPLSATRDVSAWLSVAEMTWDPLCIQRAASHQQRCQAQAPQSWPSVAVLFVPMGPSTPMQGAKVSRWYTVRPISGYHFQSLDVDHRHLQCRQANDLARRVRIEWVRGWGRGKRMVDNPGRLSWGKPQRGWTTINTPCKETWGMDDFLGWWAGRMCSPSIHPGLQGRPSVPVRTAVLSIMYKPWSPL